jgi:mannose-1-phosphate guanylyltransferase
MTDVAVVLAGGRGTRLYPASTADRPKQFRSFGGERSLLARTVERAGAVVDRTVVLTRPAYADRIREMVPGADVLVEPAPKDTGPALLYAASELRDEVADPTLLCLPSDHAVGEGYAAAFARACEVARETDGLVTLGIEPTRPATGYGYVAPGAARGTGDYRTIEEFVEKPDAETAARYRERGYLWNAGVFAWRPAALLDAARAAGLGGFLDDLARDPAAAFAAVDPVSVDRAVLEPAAADGRGYVVPADVAWDDLGAWDALRRVRAGDADGNVTIGETLTLDAADCVVAAGDGQHVSVAGVSDLVVAAYDGRVLVVPADEAQRVREVVARIEDVGEVDSNGRD